MTSVRARTCAGGAAVAVAAGVLTHSGAVLGAELATWALLGTAAGAVVALVPDRSAVERAAAFLLGLLAAWGGFALRAGVLPDVPLGRALSVVAALSLVAAVATATAGRLPLRAGLTGAAAFAGAYTAGYVADPPAFATESVTALTSVLLAAAIGFLVVTLVDGSLANPAGRHRATTAPGGSSDSLDDLFPSPRAEDSAPAQSETSR
jgi:hypothetical protein